ncbi:MAG: thioredoxin domain-containing protein [Lacibacter sp.]
MSRKSVCGVMLLLVILHGCSNQQNKQQKNRLENASSQYLKEHADNPVNWYEWGDEALAKAKLENKPLLISIGYSSCHWCHVMERESFMDTAVARLMNESFVCIKVDREERPDIDNIYVHACQLLNNGEAGWPLNAFALPDGKPFFAGTYYSKENWVELLKQITDSYKHKNGKVVLQANSITYGIIDNDQLLFKSGKEKNKVSKEMYQSLYENVGMRIDFTNGGLKGKQKFPNPSLCEFLLQYHYLTGNEMALNAAVNTLTKMALGGIYDYIGGGFARYSTDSLWRIPHFEKMLYDNGQLVSLYAHAYQLTKNDFFKKTLTETIAFVDRELTSPQGGFYSSLNAETEGVEGVFYTWSFDDFNKTVGTENAKLVTEYYNILPQGNWEKKQNVLFATKQPAEFAVAKKLDTAEFTHLLNEARNALFVARNKRLQPTADTKILTSWNAIMLRGYLDAYTATGNEAYLQKALINAAFLEKNMLSPDGSLKRNYKDGKASVNAFLDDYAWMSWAYIKLYQVTFNKHWLIQAKKITDYSLENFYDKASGMFYYAAANSVNLVVKKMEVQDNVIPSSNAVMAGVLYSLGTFFSDSNYVNKSLRMLSVVSGNMNKMPEYYAQWCLLSGLKAYGSYEVAVMGTNALTRNLDLQRNYLPTCLFMGETNNENLPLLKDKFQNGKTMIYICSNEVCKFPVEAVENALRQIK